MKWLARSSIFIIFFTLLWLVYYCDIKSHLSISLDTILPQSSAKDALITYQKINQTQDIIFATKGEQSSKINEYLKQVEKEIPSFSTIYPQKKSHEEFLDTYRFYLNNMPENIPNKEQIEEKLTDLKDGLLDGFLISLDKTDPLMLFKKKEGSFLNIPTIEGFDKTFFFRISASPAQYEQIYNILNSIVPKSNDIFMFSPFFYNVENSKIFKSQAQLIISFSTIILGFLYLYLLRRPMLFIYTVTTLVSSTAFAQLVAFTLWNEISVYTLVFSGAISTVSIDYMFHHYLHNAYGDNKKFLKPVFYGFITTFIAFLALSFVNFTLISQIALTSATSLLFAYLCFTFIYPKLGLGNVRTKEIKYSSKNIIRPLPLLVISAIIIFISPFWLTFNMDIRALDVQNTNLLNKQLLVERSLHVENKTAVMISGATIDGVIEKSKTMNTAYFPASSLLSHAEHKLRQDELQKLDFKSLKKNIKEIGLELGFKENYFDNAYNENALFPSVPTYTQKFLSENALRITKESDKFYATGYADKSDIKYFNSDDIVAIDSVMLFEKELKNVAKELFIVGLFIIILISGVIYFLTNADFIRAFNFIVVPFSACLLLFLFIDVLILHIFMIIIIVAMSVDYGIYNACVAGNRTNEAIFYSLLSTMAGFGVLSISYISSLQAIGLVALCATITTAFLLYFTKVEN